LPPDRRVAHRREDAHRDPSRVAGHGHRSGDCRPLRGCLAIEV